MPNAILPQNTRNSDPESSHLAGEQITESGTRQTQCDAVLDAVQKMPRATARELASTFDLDRYMVSRRLADLCYTGKVRKAASRECEVGGRLSCTWVEIDKHQLGLF